MEGVTVLVYRLVHNWIQHWLFRCFLKVVSLKENHTLMYMEANYSAAFSLYKAVAAMAIFRRMQ